MVTQVTEQGAPAGAAEARHSMLHVGEEALAGLLAVVAHLDAGIDLRRDGPLSGGGDLDPQLVRIHGLAPTAPTVELREGRRPRQAPGMGGEEA